MLASPENNLSLNLSAGTDAKNQKYEFALQTAGAGFSDSINNLKGNNAFSGYLKDFENYANIVMGKTPEFTFNPENYYINNFKNWGTENIKNSEENKNLKKSASWAVQAQQSAVNFLFNQAGSYAANFLNNLVAPKLTKYLGDLGLGTAGTQIVGTLQGTITEFIRGGIETAFSGFKANVLNTINNTSTRVPLSEIPSTKPSTIPGDTGPQKGAGEIVDDAKNEAISNAGEEVAASVKKQTSALTMQWLKVRNQAYDRLANIGATYAQKYAETIGNELIDKLDNLGDKFGGQVGSSFLQALARQVRNYVGDNLKKSVSAWLQNQLLGKNANTKWSEFKIDWTLVAAETLAGVIGNKEIAEVVDAGYRAARSMLGLVLNYEEFSELDYLFLVEDGNTGLVSSALNKMMNPKIAGLDIIKNKLKDASPLPRLISSKLFLTGAAAGLGTGGINSAFQYSPFWDSTQFYDGMMYDMSGIGYGINIRSLIYVTFGRIKLPRIKDGIFTDTATLYNSSIWQMALGSVLPVDLQRAVSGDFLGALTGFFGNIADSYILCDMRENTSAVSSVQVALSLSGQLGGVYTGIPIVSMNLPKGVEIMKEAYTFALFTVQNMAAGGFGGTIKDKTHNPVAMYNLNTGEYTIGPFKVDYNRSSVKTSRGKSEFGLMTNMRIYDQNGTPINGWNIIWEEGGKSGRDSINADDPFPNPNEDFYIRFYNYQSNNIQAISRIELEYKEMQALTQYNTLSGFYFRNCIPDPTEVKITVFYDTWTHISLGFNIPLKFIVGIGNGPDIISVNYAKKYYINHTQTITN